VLRFWETEFKKIKPLRTPSGQRLYRKKDVELILEIKRCLYEKKFTIEGARKHLKKSPKKRPEAAPPSSLLSEIRLCLIEIRNILESDP
jgi:DNA-binding transcriptional MerR regulator